MTSVLCVRLVCLLIFPSPVYPDCIQRNYLGVIYRGLVSLWKDYHTDSQVESRGLLNSLNGGNNEVISKIQNSTVLIPLIISLYKV